MQLIRLIYASTLKKSVEASEVQTIHKIAHERNAARFISGVLVFGDDFFVQCLEGQRSVVSQLFSKISVDPRHERVMLYQASDISKRNFEKWSMKLIVLSEEKRKMIFRYSKDDTFNPYEMSADSALQFLLEISA